MIQHTPINITNSSPSIEVPPVDGFLLALTCLSMDVALLEMLRFCVHLGSEILECFLVGRDALNHFVFCFIFMCLVVPVGVTNSGPSLLSHLMGPSLEIGCSLKSDL